MLLLSKLLVLIVIFRLLLEVFSIPIDYEAGDVDYEDNENFTFLITGGYRPPQHTLVKHIVSIRTASDYKIFGYDHFCGGSILSPKIILTAAHCLSMPRFYIRVVTGTPQRFIRTSTTMVLKVSRVKVHPSYSARTHQNDIGLLILEDEIVEYENSTVRIPLASRAPRSGTGCTAVGWGRVISYGPLAADALYVDLEIWATRKCRNVIPHWRTGMICAGDVKDSDKDTCSGDSGGPLICDEEVMGVTSFGYGCGESGRAGVYSDVWHFREWIIANRTSKCGPDLCLLLLLPLAMVFRELRQRILH